MQWREAGKTFCQGECSVVEDFLPAPDQLAFREENVKVTIALSKSSIGFFKRIARNYRSPYQQ